MTGVAVPGDGISNTRRKRILGKPRLVNMPGVEPGEPGDSPAWRPARSRKRKRGRAEGNACAPGNKKRDSTRTSRLQLPGANSRTIPIEKKDSMVSRFLSRSKNHAGPSGTVRRAQDGARRRKGGIKANPGASSGAAPVTPEVYRSGACGGRREHRETGRRRKKTASVPTTGGSPAYPSQQMWRTDGYRNGLWSKHTSLRPEKQGLFSVSELGSPHRSGCPESAGPWKQEHRFRKARTSIVPKNP